MVWHWALLDLQLFCFSSKYARSCLSVMRNLTRTYAHRMANCTRPLNSHSLTCHCGAVAIKVNLPCHIKYFVRCNCSFCSRKYGVMTNVETTNLEVLKGHSLKEYTFHTETSKHWFCSICGIHTHHNSRNNPTTYALNLACVEGIKIEEFADAPWFDGRKHPKDYQILG